MTRIKMTKLSAKNGAWFIKVRGSYLPASREGWLTYLPLVTVGILLLIALSEEVYHGADLPLTLVEFTADLIIVGVFYTWLAKRKS